MDTRLQEGIIGFLLFVVGKENQTANFICKWGNSLMCKTVVRSALPFFFFFFFWHGIPAIVIFEVLHKCWKDIHNLLCGHEIATDYRDQVVMLGGIPAAHIAFGQISALRFKKKKNCQHIWILAVFRLFSFSARMVLCRLQCMWSTFRFTLEQEKESDKGRCICLHLCGWFGCRGIKNQQ